MPTVMTSFPAHLSPAVLSNGLLLVDKPEGWHVDEVVEAVRRATRAAKVASLAPLDASASGLVLLAFGDATRLLARRVERSPKRYEGSLLLGASSDSGDVRGAESLVPGVLPWQHVTDADLQLVAASLVNRSSPSPAAEHPGRSAAVPGGGSSSSHGSDGSSGKDDDSAAAGEAVASGSAAGARGSSNGWPAAHGSGSNASNDVPAGGDVNNSGGPYVLAPRVRLQQLPSSRRYFEEDTGAQPLFATQLDVRDFRVWREPLAVVEGAAGGAGVDERAAPGITVLGAGTSSLAAPSDAHAGAADRTTVASSVRFSVQLAGKGYLRPLVALLGRRLRTAAVLDELRRTEVGSFSVEDAWALEAVLPLLRRYQG